MCCKWWLQIRSVPLKVDETHLDLRIRMVYLIFFFAELKQNCIFYGFLFLRNGGGIGSLRICIPYTDKRRCYCGLKSDEAM